MDTWVEALRLHLSEKLSIEQIARALRMRRNAVRRTLRGDEPPEKARGPRGRRSFHSSRQFERNPRSIRRCR